LRELDYYERHKPEYEKSSHRDKPLRVHCEEVAFYVHKLCNFYNINDEVLQAVGEYLAYYHDLGKLASDWQYDNPQKPPHSPKSLEMLRKDRVLFQTMKGLTPILYYMVLKHHGRLSLPAQFDGADALTFYLRSIDLRTFRVDPRDLADIFGLFKIADALSAADPKHRPHIERFMTKRPNYSQESVKNLIHTIDEDRWKEQLAVRCLPDIAMLRAPTGWGKTTVSLLYPLDKTCSRVFYLLPTITAINSFFEKLHNAFGDDVSKIFYFYDTEVKENEEKLATLFFARSFLTPVVITTVDQFLLSFLQCGRYHTKRVAFRNSSIILDEVHLLNPVMLTLLTDLVEMYRDKYCLRLLLMSATFPRALERYLKQRLRISDNSFLDFGDEYRRRKNRVRFDLSEEDITKYVDDIRHEYEAQPVGKRILVICNTVGKSVKLAKLLRQAGCETRLLHARFMYRDRREKEMEIDKDLKHEPHVLVATQVCEVSLDVSYQSLHTEAAPLGSIIQRFGRVNRYSESSVDNYNIHLYYPSELRNCGKDLRYPYGESEVKTCWTALERLRGPLMSSEWQLIEEFDRLLPYDLFKKELDEARSEIDFNSWEEMLQYFYSLDISEQKLRSIIDYRDSFTALVLPHPRMIIDKQRREEITQLMNYYDKLTESPEEVPHDLWTKIFASAKEHCIPIPLRWLKESHVERKLFPVTEIPNVVYEPDFGLVRRDE